MNPRLRKLYQELNECPEFLAAMGAIRQGDEYTITGVIHRINCPEDMENVYDNKDMCIFIPRTIDDSSEEASKRSLIGMLDVPPIITPIYNQLEDGNPTVCWELDWINGNYTESAGGETITEAILRALLAQWGREVKG
jgi:hypothetical protein